MIVLFVAVRSQLRTVFSERQVGQPVMYRNRWLGILAVSPAIVCDTVAGPGSGFCKAPHWDPYTANCRYERLAELACVYIRWRFMFRLLLILHAKSIYTEMYPCLAGHYLVTRLCPADTNSLSRSQNTLGMLLIYPQ